MMSSKLARLAIDRVLGNFPMGYRKCRAPGAIHLVKISKLDPWSWTSFIEVKIFKL